VLADSLYGESGCGFIDVSELKLDFAVAIRSKCGLVTTGTNSSCNRWRKFERVFSDGKSELRYIREIIYGKRRAQQFWELN